MTTYGVVSEDIPFRDLTRHEIVERATQVEVTHPMRESAYCVNYHEHRYINMLSKRVN